MAEAFIFLTVLETGGSRIKVPFKFHGKFHPEAFSLDLSVTAILLGAYVTSSLCSEGQEQALWCLVLEDSHKGTYPWDPGLPS